MGQTEEEFPPGNAQWLCPHFWAAVRILRPIEKNLCFRTRKPFLELPVKSDFVEPLQTILETEDWEEKLTPCVKGCKGSGQTPGRDIRAGQRGGFTGQPSPQPGAPACKAGISLICVLQKRKVRLGKVNGAA